MEQKSECGYGCGRAWDEPGEFNDCVSAYHLDAMKKTPHLQGSEEEMIEKLAAIEHERWADWQKYCHSKGILDEFGNLKFMSGYIKNWERQINTHYNNLTEEEKQSDRDQVMRYWPLIQELLLTQRKELGEKIKNKMKEWPDYDKNPHAEMPKEYSGYNIALNDVLKLLS